MVPGFIPGSRASFMFDFVVTAMAFIVPVMVFSIRKAKAGDFHTHRLLQTALAVTLLVAVLLFEVDVRMNDWRVQAQPSPYYETWLFPVLAVHLFFAINATWLWAFTTIQAWRNFARPPKPAAYSSRHRLFGKATALFTIATTITGWTFYTMAFLAS